MRDKEVKKIYRTNAKIYDFTRFENIPGKIMDKKQKRILLEYISNFDKDVKILEVGCGTGRFLKFLESKGYHQLSGIDQAKTMLNIAKNKTSAKLRFGDAYSLPYNDGEFDVVFSIHVLMHLDFPERMLAEMLRVCKKLVIVDINNKISPFSFTSYLFRSLQLSFGFKKHNRPNIFSINQIKKMVGNRKVLFKPTYFFPLRIPFKFRTYYRLTLLLEKFFFFIGLKKLSTQLFLGIKK